MSYQFKLEALRRYRRHQEESKQKDLAEAQRVRDEAVDILNHYLDMRDQTEEDLKNKQQESATGPHMALYDSFFKKLSEDIRAQRLEVEKFEQLCTRKREALLIAMQKRKTLEKLKEKGLSAYLDNLNHEEQKFINEMAINRYNLNQR